MVDPSQEIYSKMDIAFYAGKVSALEQNIEAKPGRDAKFVIDASERIVTPGLIDLHVHVFESVLGLLPEALTNTGITTAFDAGSVGANTFLAGINFMTNYCATRIYSFINISALGLSDRPELEDITYGNVDKAVRICKENRNLVKGIKVRLTKNALKTSNPFDAFMRAKEAADEVKLPLMVHGIRTNEKDILKGIKLRDILNEMKKGDILTHVFANHSGIMEDEKVIPELLDAIERGVILDVGHGMGSFSFDVAKKTLEQGVQPNTISTDLHKASYMYSAFDLPTIMSKFMYLGLPLYDVIKKVTLNPAKALGIDGSIGTLKVGAVADAVIFDQNKGQFNFTDTEGKKETGQKKLIPKAVFRAGDIYLAGTWSQVKWKTYKATWA